jgi:hypothetical protein
MNRCRVDGDYLHVHGVLADSLEQQFQKKTSNPKTCLNVATLHTTHVCLCDYPKYF